MKTFDAYKLRELRCSLDPPLSQADQAEELGVDVRTYRRYESGEVNHPDRGFELRTARQVKLVDAMVRYFALPGRDELIREVPAPGDPPSAFPAPASWYVHRNRIEAQALDYLRRPGCPVVLYAADGFGKTCLAEHLLGRVAEGGKPWRSTRIHLPAFAARDCESYERFLRSLADAFAEDFAIEGPLLHALLADDQSTPRERLSRLLGRLLEITPGNLLIAIYGAERLADAPFRDELFGLLRGLMEEDQEPWRRLRLLVTSSIPASRLDGRGRESPFGNLCDPILLPGFDRAEVESLVRAFQLAWTAADITRVMSLVGGHPGLLLQAAVSRCAVEELLRPEFYLELFEVHLRRRRRLLERRPRLRQLLRALDRPPAERGGTIDEWEVLREVGIVERDGGNGFRLRCELYRSLI